MDTAYLILAGFGLFFAGIIKGATGLGYSSCALPFLAPAVGLKIAIPLLLLPTLASNIQLVLTAGHFSETLKRLSTLYLASIPGIAVGLLTLQHIDIRAATAALGCVIAAYASFALAHPEWRIGATAERVLQLPVGLLNGFFTGWTGSQVMPLFPYIMSIGLDANRLVQAVNLAVTLASTVLAIGAVWIGLLTWQLFGYSALAIIPAFVGVSIGNRLRQHMPVAVFRKLILSMFFVMGFALLLSSIR